MKETADAKKVRIGAAEALQLAGRVDTIIAVRGKQVVTLDLKKDKPDDETLLAHLLGPTGNLRAPTIRMGRTLLVGFQPDAYCEVLGLK